MIIIVIIIIDRLWTGIDVEVWWWWRWKEQSASVQAHYLTGAGCSRKFPPVAL